MAWKPVMDPKVLMYGNPADGFRVVGPFENAEAATAYLETERDRSDWWIMDLDAPATQQTP